jgi:uncharacterized protein (AIM24 family)
MTPRFFIDRPVFSWVLALAIVLSGTIALLSAGGPLIALGVTPQTPLVADPDAFVAFQGQLNQSFVTDVTWRSAVGGGSGEAFSLRFDGHGVVYIQPEER